MSTIAAGPELVIPQNTVNIQYRPQVTALQNGNYLVTWADGSGKDPDGNTLPVSSGFTRFGQIFDASGSPVGRKLDFLAQEFNREANTLCSKAQNASLTAIGLDMKTVIDQMREQVQNVE